MSEPSFKQFAAPTAEVRDISSGATSELNLFSTKGRIGRLRYLAYTMGAQLIWTAVTAAIKATVPSLAVPFSVLGLAVLCFGVIVGIKRCHDMGISGWWTLTSIIPIIALAWVFYPGDQGENRFGPPPPPNTAGVRILGAILPAIFVVGIIAAIAIPQYARYTQAHALQHPAGN